MPPLRADRPRRPVRLSLGRALTGVTAAALVCIAGAPASAGAQLLSQSELGVDDPDPAQDRATDPWYVVDRAGTEVRMLSDEDVARIPTSTVWSHDRTRAAWVRDGVLHVWDATRGIRTPYHADGGIRDLALSADGSMATFSTRHDRGELWSLDLEAGALRQVARVVTEEEEDTTDTERWLVEQQLELIETLAERKRKGEPIRWSAPEAPIRCSGSPWPRAPMSGTSSSARTAAT